MRKIVMSLLIGLALMIVPSMAATGHINGCTNTGTWNNCCTKTFNITAKPGYRIVDVIVNGVSKGAITSYTFGNLTSAQVLKVVTEAIPQTTYTIAYNLAGGTVNGNPISYTAESESITLINPVKEGYTFKGWTGTGLNSMSVSVTIPKGSTGNREYIANWNIKANDPVLTSGLRPVNWNGTSWATTTIANWEYNYNSVATIMHNSVEGNGDGKWANAQASSGLYVWIPRYSYKITSGEHQSGNSWNSLENPETNKIEIKFSNGLVDDTADGYIVHPAFTLGTDELKGIWVMKYEASSYNSEAYSSPNQSSEAKMSVGEIFDYAYNTYRAADSHLMKNIEWGAVAYLTNAIGRIPYINNNISKTGYAGRTQSASGSSSNKEPTYAWNTERGVKASTTHNVYGIYDMSGGEYECVAAYYAEGNSDYLSSDTSNVYAGKLYTAANTSSLTKYVDIYTAIYDSTKKGDAIYETSVSYGSSAWDGDYSRDPDTYAPIFLRGGMVNSTEQAGIFAFSNCNGSNDSQSISFRVVLGIK